jgi:hypothetical protein
MGVDLPVSAFALVPMALEFAITSNTKPSSYLIKCCGAT